MEHDSVTVMLDPITSAVLRAYAQSRGQSREEAIAALLYRTAASMTGWPGANGKEFEYAALTQMAPPHARDDIGDL